MQCIRDFQAWSTPRTQQYFEALCTNYGLISALLMSVNVGCVGSVGPDDWLAYGDADYKYQNRDWFVYNNMCALLIQSFLVVMCSLSYITVQSVGGDKVSLKSFAMLHIAMHFLFVVGVVMSGFGAANFVVVKAQSSCDESNYRCATELQANIQNSFYAVGALVIALIIYLFVLVNSSKTTRDTPRV